MTRRTFYAMVGLLIVAALSGCKQSATPGVEPTPGDQAVTTEPQQPLVATFIMWQDFIDLAPAYTYGSEETVMNQCYENLIWANPPGSSELLRPGLATSWEHNDDATEWTFHLREGVNFQDGTPWNADAVKATIEYYLAQEGAGCSWIWGPVDRVEVVDPLTVKVFLTHTAALDIISTASFCGYMVSPSAVDKPKEWFDSGNCVGTGPYTIESYSKGERLVMTRFDGYWGGWEGAEDKFDKIVYEVVADRATQLQLIENGDADFMAYVPPDQLTRLGTNPNLKTVVAPSYYHFMFHLNTKKAPLDNVLVRQALSYSFPYQQLVERSNGVYKQSRGALPEAYWAYGKDLFQYSYDLDKARELLAEAGYPDGGFELTVTYMPDLPGEVWAVELWASSLEKLGITLKPQGMTFESLWELAKGDPMTAQDIATFGWYPSYVDPYDPMFTLYHCEDEPYLNVGYYCNPEYDKLIDEAHMLTATDRDEAARLFIEAQEILIEDAPAIFLVEAPNTWAYAADITGFVDNPAYTFVAFFYDLTTTR